MEAHRHRRPPRPRTPPEPKEEPAQQGGTITPAGTPASGPVAAAPEPAGEAPAQAKANPEPERGTGQRLRVSPVARMMAEELGVDLHAVQGSGPDGRIMRRDVEAAAQSNGAPVAASQAPDAPLHREAQETRGPAPKPGREQRDDVQPLSRMRQAIARRMAQSKREAPHYYITVNVDMTEAMAFRSQVNSTSDNDVHLTVNDLLIKAAVNALQKYPSFNASFGDDGLIEHAQINLCIAIALADGLVAPAILDCGGKSLGEIARQVRDLSERARDGHLRPAELSDGTFTISNLGAYGVETLIPIIQPSQAAIIGAGAVQSEPVVRAGQIVIREMLKLALAADHRVTDGAQGAEFMCEVKTILETPLRLAL